MAKERFERTKPNRRYGALRSYFCAMSLVALILVMCQCDDHKIITEKPPGVITGLVRDSVSDMLLENAWIGPDSTFDTTRFAFSFTDSMGQYRYPTLSLDGLLFSGREGYYTSMRGYQVAHGESIIVDFYLEPR